MQTLLTTENGLPMLTEQEQVNNWLYDYQQFIITNPRPKQIYNKARQIGFSMSLAVRAYRQACARPFEAMYTSVGERQASEWLDKIRLFLLMDGVKPIVDKNIMIKLPNGSRFISLPQNPATVRGYAPDEIYIDEFAHYQKDRAMLTALVPSLTRTDKQRVLIIGSTPMGNKGEFFRLWDTDKTYSKYNINILEAASQGCPVNVDECRKLCPDEQSYQQEYLCQFIDDIYSYFPYEMIKACWNYDLTDWTPDQMSTAKGTIYAGYDPAKFQDSGVFIVAEKIDNRFYVRHIKEWQQTPYTTQLEYIKEVMKKGKITKLAMDRTGVGEKLYEDLRAVFNSRVDGVTFTNSSKEKMIIDLRVLFQDKRIEIPYNMKLSNQLHGLQKVITEAKNMRYTHASGQHDDYVWALALATSNLANPKIISARYLGED